MRLTGCTACLSLMAFLAMPFENGMAQAQMGTNAIGGGVNPPASAQGEMFLQLQFLQEEVTRLRGLLEEQQNALHSLQQESLERYQSLEHQIANSSTPPVTPTDTEPEQAQLATPPEKDAAPVEPVDAEKEKLYYDAAFELIKARDFDQAGQALSGFLHKYPSSQYSANAQYWLGEVHLVKGEFAEAQAAFALVVQQWPQHTKVPDALYKQADAYQRLGEFEKARSLLQEVSAKYPSSSAAKLAKRDLQQNP